MLEPGLQKSRYVLGLIGVTACSIAPCPVRAQGTEAEAAAIEEVVVTAQKREESIQDVPIAVSAFTGEQLDTFKIDSGMEITKYTPNFRASVAGNEDQPKYTIRGLSQFDFNLNASSPTGVFYDEVYVASQFLGGPQTFDLQRVEVLRGPQGTLFGKNTVGGAVNFISKGPTFGGDANAHLALDAGSNRYSRVEGATDVELVEDVFAARIAFNSTQSNGWVENHNPAPSAQDMSSIDSNALRVSLAYQSESDFDATLRLWGTRSNPTAIGIIEYGRQPTDPVGGTLDARVNPYTGQPFDVHEAAYDESGRIEVKGGGGYLTLNKGLGAYTLTSITSYISGDFANNVDGDGSIATFFRLNFLASSSEVSQDLRLSSNYDGPLNFIAGLYYFGDTTEPDTTLTFFGNGAPTTYEQTRTSYAAYVDGTYAISGNAEIFMGVRATNEKGEITDFAAPADYTRNPPISAGRADYSETEPSGRAGVRYTVSDDLMVYAQYARGYRSSGINGGAGCNAELNVANPEFLNAFELGFKSEWADKSVRINANLFRYDFKDQQFRSAIAANATCPNPFAPPCTFNPLATKLVNAAKSTTNGAELEAMAFVTESFSVMLGLGWLDATYEDLTLYDGARDVDLSGNDMLEAPSYTAILGLDYSIPMNLWKLSMHADANWTDKQYYTAFNTEDSSSPAHWESNLRVALTSNDGKFDIGVWAKNLNDNTANTWVVANAATGTRFTTIPYPRRYGVDFRWNF